MSRIMSQQILESLPILPEGFRPANLADQLGRPVTERQGFWHGNGEWNFLYLYDDGQQKRWYRLPESLAIVLVNETNQHNRRYTRH